MSDRKKETVVLLHGLIRTGKSMKKLEGRLQEAGYDTINVTYPSTKRSMEGLADYLHKKYLVNEFAANANKLHFVTHSMGGLVTRKYLDKYKPNNLGRVVMIAPPNGGSEVADKLSDIEIFRKIYGPAALELTTEFQKAANDNIYYDLGIIAGTKKGPFVISGNFIIEGKNDGRVSVESTKIKGMKDHVEIKAPHPMMVNNKNTYKHIVSFLKNGNF
jgi:triacylglycerol esterase/lipase EstA (alpha/beta hydrolase family)